jgi:hypothetical protein
MSSLLEAKKAIEEVFIQREEVIGIGVDERTQHIKVYVLQDEYDRSVPDIPRMMSGYHIDIIPIPGFMPLNASTFRSNRFRPVVGGVSAAHSKVSAGTIGSVIRDKNTGQKLLLSNNHVFANTTSRTNFRGHIGDHIYQPGSADGGTEADTVATLYKFIPFNDSGMNLVDAALAMPTSQDIVSPYILIDGKSNTTAIHGIRTITDHIAVKKYSRTSTVDWGKVLDWNFTVAVDFDDGRTRNFVDQILVEIETRGGDSGSMLLDENDNAVGLIFAGGVDKNGKWYGVANKIRNVLAMFADDDVDISDGWKPSDAMMETPPQFDMGAVAMDLQEVPVQDNTMRNAIIAGAGMVAAAALWQHLNRREL